jgi:hypothetical protein
MNLLDKANIITTPTAYSEGKLHSVKPNVVLGNELITNGDFATDSGWTTLGGWSIGGGSANCNGGSIMYTNGGIEVSKTYKVTYTIINYVSGNVRSIFNGSTTDGNGTTRNANGTFTELVQSTDNASGTFSFGAVAGSFIGSIDNVSVKEDISADFDFTRNSSATRVGEDGYIQDVQIIGGELVQNGDFEEIGSELIVNGDFATDSDWNKDSGWTISGGTANSSGVGYSRIYQDEVLTSGKIYKLRFDITAYTSGQLEVYNNGQWEGAYDAVNSYEKLINANTSFLYFRAKNSSPFTGSIDNVSVKEVGQNWAFSTGWSIADGKVYFNNPTGTEFYQSLSTTASKYRISFDLDITSGTIQTSFSSPSTSTIQSFTTSGTKTVDITTTASFSRFRFVGVGGSVFNINNVSVKEVTDDTNLPRINYENGIGHLLLEPQRTNLITYSEDYSQSEWTNAPYTKDASITYNSASVAPDGTLGVYQYECTVSGTNSQLGALKAISSGVAYSNSVYLRRITGSGIVKLRGVNNGDIDVTSELTSSWKRFKITQTSNSTDGRFYVNALVSGDVIEVWGAQLELGSYPTSYIVSNSGSATTRLAETCNNAGNSDIIPSDEGVLYAEIALLENDGVNSISISSGSNNDRVLISYNSIGRLDANILSGSAYQAIFNYTGVSNTKAFNKIAFKYKENDFALWVNGIEVATDSSGITPVGLNVLNFSTASIAAANFYGKTRMVAVFPYLSDDELECLTS